MSEHRGESPEHPSPLPAEPPVRRTPTAALLDEGLDRLRVELLGGPVTPGVETVLRLAGRRRRRRRVLSSAAVGATVLVGTLTVNQLPRLLPGSTLSHPSRVVASAVEGTPSPLPSGPAQVAWTSAQLPLAANEMPSIWAAYGPWSAVASVDGAPAVAAFATDHPGCLAGPVEALGAWEAKGADYQPAVPAEFGDQAGQVRAYQYVLGFMDSAAADQAGRVLSGAYGCKGGHGGLTKAAGDSRSTVLHEVYSDAAGHPLSYVEEFSVAVSGVRVGVIGVRRVYRPGELGFGTPLGVDQQFSAAADMLRYRLATG
ncbi:hypothetical protein [Kitasatospora viridis]|uniref:Uncharacterized protein n=1 Tax=Kitasatospora viridis TaxID=281105 RepID=A0A561UKU6_9ACTN|nr:hypothetical protein [Kitasatospora viridis]TWF99981.1 hypothetical protein FHX73_113846 [Kitasatospora viridis]